MAKRNATARNAGRNAGGNAPRKSHPGLAGAGLPPQIENQFRDQVRKLREAIQQNAENVGKRFPEEARKIHYGEAEKRGIFGEASPQEAKELIDEGVEILPIPVLPEDKN